MTHSPPDPIHPTAATVLDHARSVARAASANAAALDLDGAFPDDDVRRLFEAGLLHAPFPAAMGGIDLGSSPCDPILTAEVLTTIGRGSLPLGRLFEGHVNAVKLVRLYGSASNLMLLQAEADAGRLTGVWMAEDHRALKLQGSDATMTLDGCKVLASGACHIKRPLVAAATERGNLLVLPFVDRSDRIDLSLWVAQGMKATATGTVDFSGLAIAPRETVGCPGDYMRSPFFRGGAWRVMAVQLGGVQALFEAYRAQLVESGRDTDRLQRERFGAAAAAVETARLWVLEACARAEDTSGDPEAIDAYVDLMRGAFEQAALTVVASAEKSLGLKSFLRPNALERIARDLTTYLRQPALDASRDAAAAYFFHHPATSVCS